MLDVIVAAAGRGERLGLGMNKAFAPLCGVPLMVRTLAQVAQVEGVGMVIVAVGECEVEEAKQLLARYQKQYFPSLTYRIIAGGAQRQDTVRIALSALGEVSEAGYVAVHDGARPFADKELFARVLAEAQVSGAAIPAIAVKDTIKVIDNAHSVVATPERASLRAVQTPQIFSSNLLRRAYAASWQQGLTMTDDASAVESLGVKVTVVTGSEQNIKITTPEDLLLAREILGGDEQRIKMRVGSGYDVHRLVPERRLVLCGVEIPYSLGLLGHSDADVALHALMDALLGAAGQGDIGRLFPDTDAKYKDIDSVVLLRQVVKLLQTEGWQVENVDVTIIAQRPKLAPYRSQMEQVLSCELGISLDAVNVKATTTEGLGFTGRGEGIAAQAVVGLRGMRNKE